jgi:hypothetical protein
MTEGLGGHERARVDETNDHEGEGATRARARHGGGGANPAARGSPAAAGSYSDLWKDARPRGSALMLRIDP